MLFQYLSSETYKYILLSCGHLWEFTDTTQEMLVVARRRYNEPQVNSPLHFGNNFICYYNFRKTRKNKRSVFWVVITDHISIGYLPTHPSLDAVFLV